jgi:hypothetical protein
MAGIAVMIKAIVSGVAAVVESIAEAADDSAEWDEIRESLTTESAKLNDAMDRARQRAEAIARARVGLDD